VRSRSCLRELVGDKMEPGSRAGGHDEGWRLATSWGDGGTRTAGAEKKTGRERLRRFRPAVSGAGRAFAFRRGPSKRGLFYLVMFAENVQVNIWKKGKKMEELAFSEVRSSKRLAPWLLASVTIWL
jgi:hypothetical protein